MKKRVVFLSAIVLLFFVMIGCVSEEANDKQKGGEECKYRKIQGKSIILSIDNIDEGNKLVKFNFVPDKETKYLFPKINDTAYLKVHGNKNISQEFIEKHNIKIGGKFECFREEITQGTCTPVGFNFPDFKGTNN